MKRNHRIGFAAVAAIALIFISYFALIPELQISDYKRSADEHTAVHDKMLRVFDNFQSGVFTKPGTSPTEAATELTAGKDVVTQAQAALNANQFALTKFHALPLLSFNPRYKAAKELDVKETEYVKKARSLLVSYQELLDYTAKQNDLTIQSNAVTSDLVRQVQPAATPTTASGLLDGAIARLNSIKQQREQLTPPEYLSEYHTVSLSRTSLIITALQFLMQSFRDLNFASISTGFQKMKDAILNAGSQTKDYVTELSRDGKIQLEIVQLRSLNQDIVKGYSQL